MPQPTAGDVHVNTPLTQLSIAFLQKQTNFIAARAFPNVPVSKQSDRYYTYDRGHFNRDQMELRAPSTESAGSGFSVDSTPTYFCHRWSLHKDIDDEYRANADSVIAPDRDAVNFLTHQALIRREKLFVEKYFAGGLWTNDYDGIAGSSSGTDVKQWSDAASTPIEDVRFAKTTILQSTGFEPNKLVLGKQVYDKLVDHPDVIDRIKYGQTQGGPAMAGVDALAKLFEVDEVLISKAIQNTAKEGATNAHSFIAGKKALLVYAPPAPGLMIPSAGYTFSWTGLMGNGVDGLRIKTIRHDLIDSDRVELDMCFDMKLVSADLGFFWDTIVA